MAAVSSLLLPCIDIDKIYRDALYAARAILEEETRQGKVYYLIDWEDDPNTGEKFEPTWEPHDFATPDLKAEWQQKDREERISRKRAAAGKKALGSPDDSQSARPAKRRKLLSRAKIRQEGARDASGKPEPEAALTSGEREIPDSCEEEGENSSPQEAVVGVGRPRVEIKVPQGFDPSQYRVYNKISSSREANPEQGESLDPALSSDLFQSPQPSHSQAKEFPRELVKSLQAPQTKHPQRSRTSFIWDEDIPEDFGNVEAQSQTSGTPKAAEASSEPIQSSAPVTTCSSEVPVIEDSGIDEDLDNEEIEALEVPDSQELCGSSSYKASETPPSKDDNSTSTDSNTKQNTQTNTEASLEALESRNSQLLSRSSPSNLQDSGSIESHFAQCASYLDQESYTETPEPTSAQVPTTQNQTQSTSNSNNSGPVAESASQIDTDLPGPPPAVEVSSPLFVSSQELPGAQFEPAQSSNKVSEEELSVGFQTQLPRVSDGEESGDLPLLNDESGEPDYDIEDHLDFGFQSEDSEPELELEPTTQEESPAKQISKKQSDPRSFPDLTDWQASKVLSQSHTQAQASTFSRPPQSGDSGTQEEPIQINSPQEENSPESQIPASQVENTQKSTSSKISNFSQASSHLPSPPVEEDIRPSIEEAEPVDIEYRPEFFSSSPICTPRRRTSSSTMDLVNEVVELAEEPLVDPTAILKAKMAKAKAARLASMSSRSPAPSLALANQNAVELNQALHISTPVGPSRSEPPEVSIFESSTTLLPAPAIGSSMASPVSAPPLQEPASFAEPAPSPPIGIDSRAYAKEKDEEPTSLKVLPLGPEVYEVPLPMTSYSRELYIRRVKIYKVQLQSFLRNEVPDETLVAEVQSLLETLQTICIHPGMLDEEPTQTEDHVLQAKWAENVSTKFIFLAEFLERMQATDNHVVILARPGQVVDELESLLIYHIIDYSRADRPRERSRSKFRVTIYPAGAQRYSVDPAFLVIAFDPVYQTFPYLEELRRQPSSPDVLAPLISLVVTNSVEHIERCFDKNIEAVGRLIKVSSCIQQLLGRVGTFKDDVHLDPPRAASQIADHVISRPRELWWPLLPMPTIDGLDLSLMSSQPLSQEQPSLSARASSADRPPSGKRQLRVEESTSAEVLKRQRLTPSNGELDDSHVSETVLRASPTPKSALISSLLQKVNDLEVQLRAKDDTEKTLREINQDLEFRCKDYESSFASIQPKYQEALNDRGEFEYQYNEANKRETRMKKMRDNKQAQVIKLRGEIDALEHELSTAHVALARSATPGVAELAAIRKELAELRVETETERKRTLSANNELECIRDIYQASSARVRELDNELQGLQEELTAFHERSTHASEEIAALRKENTQLRAESKVMGRRLEKKKEELIAAVNGRKATRAPGDLGAAASTGPFAGGTFGDAMSMNSTPR